MRYTRCHTCCMLIVAISLVLSLSSCTTNGAGPTGKHETAFLENLGDSICLQHPAGLMWQAGRSANFSNWEDAERYVQSLSLGGYTDWRLPTPEECLALSRLIEMKQSDCPMETGGNHWVSRTQNVEAGQWESNVLCDGPILRWTRDKKGTVKAVRP